MLGLRLNSECFKEKTSRGIREILNCLAPEIAGLYCVAHGEFLAYSVGGKSCSEEEIERLDREYELFLLDSLDLVGTESRSLKLFQPGFLNNFREYLYGDWTRFYLLQEEISLSTIQPWANAIPAGCQVLICCVDAAYWCVFTNDQTVLSRLNETFAHAVPCQLEDTTI